MQNPYVMAGFLGPSNSKIAHSIPRRPRIVFTWGWKEPGHPVPAGSTRVEIDLSPQNGGTLLRLTHFHVPDVIRDKHELGWSHYLGRLKIVMAGGDPGADPYSDPQFRHR